MPLLLFLCLASGASGAAQTVVSGMTWMTGFAPTWNPGAPKVVSDGLFTYAIVAGAGGDSSRWTILRRRGVEGTWEQGGVVLNSQQPPVMVIDIKGRLNIFCNVPQLNHYRFDHPAVNLSSFREIPFPYQEPVGYLNASYDATADLLVLAFNNANTLTLHFTVKYTDANDWAIPNALPATPGSAYLYARAMRVGGRYMLLASEHPIDAPNANYTAALLFYSDYPSGPWRQRDIHRVSGTNIGVPYQNWVYGLDLQQDSQGRARILLHINEDASGHTPVPEGLHIAREEDNFSLRHIGSKIDDGFTLYMDADGTMLALALLQAGHPIPHSGQLVYFRSADGGLTWSPQVAVDTGPGAYAISVQPRDGSMLGGKAVGVMYSAPLTPPFQTVKFATVPLQQHDTPQRFDYAYQRTDGTPGYVRAYTEPRTGRSYYYQYDYGANGAFTLTYSYTAGDYFQVYLASSDGTFHYYNSDGYVAGSYGYWCTDADGSRDYIYLFNDPARQTHWWYVYDYDLKGAWTQTYVYYRETYWYVAVQHSDGTFVRYDSTGYYLAN